MLMITPVHFLIQYPITATINPPNERYTINSGDPVPMENERFLNAIIEYSTILAISLLQGE